MLRKFWRDENGNYAMMLVLCMFPVIGAMAMGVDYTEMTRQRQVALNALDAAGIATAKRIVEGATDVEATTYAKQFFEANLGSVDPATTTLTVVLPKNNTGGGTLKMSAALRYKPYFQPVLTWMAGGTGSTVNFSAQSEVRLKNTLEVALALDNSGSMDELGKGSGKKRIDVLKDAAKQLVSTLASQGGLMKQVAQPVRMSLVPFAASVNVGPGNDNAAWMDTTGLSPVHHENFEWSAMSSSLNANKYAQLSGGVWYARGSGWGAQKDKPLTRFTLFDLMQRVSAKRSSTSSGCASPNVYYSGTCYTLAAATSWAGCVEARPYPYNVNDAPAAAGTPATLFVPMFAPDETDQTDGDSRPANNNWWDDVTNSGSAFTRQEYMPKYFNISPDVMPFYGKDDGPNTSCSTNAITPLTDITATAGKDTIDDAIDAMQPGGATNVPEGLAWGWRTVSGAAPFTEGRADTEKGNDKVVIVLTDGANTYYTPGSVSAQSYSGSGYRSGGNDLAGNKAIYSAYGYTGFSTPGYTLPRLFQNTSTAISKTDYSNSNYGKAMNEQFNALCANAKAGNIILMTVALDLDATNTAEKTQIDLLSSCASESRYRKNGTGGAAKMFWNSTGSSLANDFKEIANELSNLRIVG